MKRLLTISLIVLSTVAALSAQSGRVAQGEPSGSATPEQTVRQMFDEVNGYVKAKANEYAAKKVPYSDELLDQTKKEQRALAARYAASAEARKEISTDDRYYIGMLHWVASNLDGTIDNLTKFFAATDADPAHGQTARSIVVVSLAQQKKLDAAEKLLAEYLAKEPTKLTERVRMEAELAKSYEAQKDFSKMADHAEAAFAAAKAMLKDPQSASRGLDELVDAGMLVFDAYSELGKADKAEAPLDEMTSLAVGAASPSMYFYAVDKKISYMLLTGRRDEAAILYAKSLAAVATNFPDKTKQADALRRLKEREIAYKVIGAPAIELPTGIEWFPGQPRSLASMKGKVVLIDFWAVWCPPCIATFPDLKEWHEQFAADGFEILGVTRYYGASYGLPADKGAQLQVLKDLRQRYALPYDMVVADGQEAQIPYGATLLPTTVIIDRRGVVRYIGTGTSENRIAEIRAMIVKLIAEK